MFLIVMVVLATITQGQSEYEDCVINYSVFENAVFKTNNNLFKFTTTFYPPDKYNPLYVNVTYRFLDTNTSVSYQWSSATLYHIIQPRTLRYLSLLFSYIEDNRIVDLELELPGECESTNASNFLFVITQRVIIHILSLTYTCIFWPSYTCIYSRFR